MTSFIHPGMNVLDLGWGGRCTVALARRIGDDGRIVAADWHQKQLRQIWRRVDKVNLSHRLTLHQCRPGEIGLTDTFDFVLYNWVPPSVFPPHLITEFTSLIGKSGHLLYLSPSIFTNRSSFEAQVTGLRELGFKDLPSPQIRFSHVRFFEKF